MNPNATGRPRLQRGKDAARFSVTVPPALLREFKAEAKRRGIKLSELFREVWSTFKQRVDK